MHACWSNTPLSIVSKNADKTRNVRTKTLHHPKKKSLTLITRIDSVWAL